MLKIHLSRSDLFIRSRRSSGKERVTQVAELSVARNEGQEKRRDKIARQEKRVNVTSVHRSGGLALLYLDDANKSDYFEQSCRVLQRFPTDKVHQVRCSRQGASHK